MFWHEMGRDQMTCVKQKIISCNFIDCLTFKTVLSHCWDSTTLTTERWSPCQSPYVHFCPLFIPAQGISPFLGKRVRLNLWHVWLPFICWPFAEPTTIWSSLQATSSSPAWNVVFHMIVKTHWSPTIHRLQVILSCQARRINWKACLPDSPVFCPAATRRQEWCLKLFGFL